MENVSPGGALARRSRQLLQLAFVVTAGGIFVAVTGLALYVVRLAVPGNSVYPFYSFMRGMMLFGGATVALIGLGLAVRAYFTRVDNDLALRTGAYLSQHLDNRYWFVRNVNKRELGYIDAVLVGPPGVLVFRIVDNEGSFRNDRADWLQESRRAEWLPARIDPTRDCVVDIKAMREYLARNDLGTPPVFGVVVFTKDPALVRIAVKDSVVPVSHLTTLIDTLADNYMAREDRIDDQMVLAIVDLIYDR